MGLPWVRLDTNITYHDKMLRLIGRRGGKEAAAIYMFSLAWSGSCATDGHIPHAALPMIHGTERHAELLVAVGLWTVEPDGWQIHNWHMRQQTAETAELKRDIASRAGRKSACVRNHGKECGCWQDEIVTPLTNRSTTRSTNR